MAKVKKEEPAWKSRTPAQRRKLKAERERRKIAQEQKAQTIKERDAWRARRKENRNNAYTDITKDYERMGLNPTDYEDVINTALSRAQGDIGSFAEGRTPTFDAGGISSQLLGELRGDTVRGYQNAINEWAPEGAAQMAFANTADDDILNSILGEQYGSSREYLDRALSRGTLTDQGYQAALSELDRQKLAASSRLQDVGGGILEGYRGGLSDIANNARTGAGNWDFGSSYNPDTYRSQYESTLGDYQSNLEGDIRNAIGGEQFFDTSSLIQKGGTAQGAQNTGLGASGGVLYDAINKRKRDEDQSRGLGTQGSF